MANRGISLHLWTLFSYFGKSPLGWSSPTSFWFSKGSLLNIYRISLSLCWQLNSCAVHIKIYFSLRVSYFQSSHYSFPTKAFNYIYLPLFPFQMLQTYSPCRYMHLHNFHPVILIIQMPISQTSHSSILYKNSIYSGIVEGGLNGEPCQGRLSPCVYQ